MGKDGYFNPETNLHSNIPTNYVGMTINYFNDDTENGAIRDYKPISGNSSFMYDNFYQMHVGNNQYHDELDNDFEYNLYNGNISSISMKMPLENDYGNITSHLYTNLYRYDQLNRLKGQDVYKKSINVNEETDWSAGYHALNYNTKYDYDLNGNITKLKRLGAGVTGGFPGIIDDLEYVYSTISLSDINGNVIILPSSHVVDNNKLLCVTDNVETIGDNGIETQELDGDYNNYTYDKTGNLKSDRSEGINNINWDVFGKISSLQKTDEFLIFKYDGLGNRIAKLAGNGTGNIGSTYYIRDAQGNIMATYYEDGNGNEDVRHYMYGSSRLGELFNTTATGIATQRGTAIIGVDDLENFEGELITIKINDEPIMTQTPWFGITTGFSLIKTRINQYSTHYYAEVLGNKLYIRTVDYTDTYNGFAVTILDNQIATIENGNAGSSFAYRYGSKNFELTNHLGNVLATVSDKKEPARNTNYIQFCENPGQVQDETHVYDGEHASKLTPPPNGESNEADGFNNFSHGVYVNVKNGDIINVSAFTYFEEVPEIDPRTGEIISALLVMELREDDGGTGGNIYNDTWSAVKVYEGTDKWTKTSTQYIVDLPAGVESAILRTYGWIGNCSVDVWFDNISVDVLNDSEPKYLADITSFNDYYPFGSIMPGRNYQSNSYRFGYNAGSEKDDEITGVTGSHYTTYFRELDTRVVRWWSIDPKTKLTPWESPYSSMGNNPIWYNDPLGDIWDRKKDKKQASKMDATANDRIKANNAKIANLQQSTGNDDAIKSLQAQNTELQNSIDERAKMGSSNDPTRYRFKQTNKKSGVTCLKTNASGDNVIVMKYGDEAEAFHEQVHGYKRGRELLDPNVTYGSGYSADEEAAAKRREYSALPAAMRNTRGPLFQKGYFYITTANWVQRVSQERNNPKMPKEYIRIANDWLKQQGKPLIK